VEEQVLIQVEEQEVLVQEEGQIQVEEQEVLVQEQVINTGE
jgi:hypothetical protein